VWNDVDFTSGTVSINKAVDARTGKSKPLPKTANAVREIPIEPNALPLLRVLHAGRTSDEAPVLPVPRTLNDKFRAKQLPEHLKLAGVDRPRLYADTMTLRPSEFRSCRGDTGITWLALTGLPLQAMLARVGNGAESWIVLTNGVVGEGRALYRTVVDVDLPAQSPA